MELPKWFLELNEPFKCTLCTATSPSENPSPIFSKGRGWLFTGFSNASFYAGGYNDEKKVDELMMYNRKFSEILSANLDNRSLNDWKHLATKFEIPQRKTDQFGLRGPGPTALLFLHISTAKDLQDLTMGQLVHYFNALGMKQLVKVVENLTYGGLCFRLVYIV